jgi:hypothetical protein
MRRNLWLSALLLALALTWGCGQGGERETAGRQETPGEQPAVPADEAALQAAGAIQESAAREQALLAFLDGYPTSALRGRAIQRIWEIKREADEPAALDWMRSMLAHEPSDQGKGAVYQALFQRAVDNGEQHEAIFQAHEMWQAKIKSPDALNAVGWALVEDTGWDVELGAKMGDRAAEQAEPGLARAMVLDTAGWGWHKLGREVEAADRLERALVEIGEPDPELSAHLAAVYEATGAKDKLLDLITKQLETRLDGALQVKAYALLREKGQDTAAYAERLWQAREAKAVPAADFTLKDLDGREHRLSDYRGKVVMLNFWHPT